MKDITKERLKTLKSAYELALGGLIEGEYYCIMQDDKEYIFQYFKKDTHFSEDTLSYFNAPSIVIDRKYIVRSKYGNRIDYELHNTLKYIFSGNIAMKKIKIERVRKELQYIINNF